MNDPLTLIIQLNLVIEFGSGKTKQHSVFFLLHCSDKWDHIMLDDDCGAWQPRSHHTWMKQLCKRSRALSLSLCKKYATYVRSFHINIFRLFWIESVARAQSIRWWNEDDNIIEFKKMKLRIELLKQQMIYVCVWKHFSFM